ERMKARRLRWLVFATVATVCAIWIAGCQSQQQKTEQQEQPTAVSAASQQEMIERGKYLVTVAACGECHTPHKMGPNGPVPDETRLLSGHPQDEKVTPPSGTPQSWTIMAWRTNTAFFGPWGVAFAANLTPDEETGIGIWDEELFIKVMRTGKHWGAGRDIARIMPWHQYAKMTDEDLKAILAYLKSLPPIKNEVPELIPPGGKQQ
ncbi:MAG: cytochrome c, partial [Armatimonadota bacterium]|nr:cytochrome c [Armatimonadota bacterium]